MTTETDAIPSAADRALIRQELAERGIGRTPASVYPQGHEYADEIPLAAPTPGNQVKPEDEDKSPFPIVSKPGDEPKRKREKPDAEPGEYTMIGLDAGIFPWNTSSDIHPSVAAGKVVVKSLLLPITGPVVGGFDAVQYRRSRRDPAKRSINAYREEQVEFASKQDRLTDENGARKAICKQPVIGLSDAKDVVEEATGSIEKAAKPGKVKMATRLVGLGKKEADSPLALGEATLQLSEPTGDNARANLSRAVAKTLGTFAERGITPGEAVDIVEGGGAEHIAHTQVGLELSALYAQECAAALMAHQLGEEIQRGLNSEPSRLESIVRASALRCGKHPSEVRGEVLRNHPYAILDPSGRPIPVHTLVDSTQSQLEGQRAYATLKELCAGRKTAKVDAVRSAMLLDQVRNHPQVKRSGVQITPTDIVRHLDGGDGLDQRKQAYIQLVSRDFQFRKDDFLREYERLERSGAANETVSRAAEALQGANARHSASLSETVGRVMSQMQNVAAGEGVLNPGAVVESLIVEGLKGTSDSSVYFQLVRRLAEEMGVSACIAQDLGSVISDAVTEGDGGDLEGEDERTIGLGVGQIMQRQERLVHAVIDADAWSAMHQAVGHVSVQGKPSPVLKGLRTKTDVWRAVATAFKEQFPAKRNLSDKVEAIPVLPIAAQVAAASADVKSNTADFLFPLMFSDVDSRAILEPNLWDKFSGAALTAESGEDCENERIVTAAFAAAQLEAATRLVSSWQDGRIMEDSYLQERYQNVKYHLVDPLDRLGGAEDARVSAALTAESIRQLPGEVSAHLMRDVAEKVRRHTHKPGEPLFALRGEILEICQAAGEKVENQQWDKNSVEITRAIGSILQTAHRAFYANPGRFIQQHSNTPSGSVLQRVEQAIFALPGERLPYNPDFIKFPIDQMGARLDMATLGAISPTGYTRGDKHHEIVDEEIHLPELGYDYFMSEGPITRERAAVTFIFDNLRGMLGIADLAQGSIEEATRQAQILARKRKQIDSGGAQPSEKAAGGRISRAEQQAQMSLKTLTDQMRTIKEGMADFLQWGDSVLSQMGLAIVPRTEVAEDGGVKHHISVTRSIPQEVPAGYEQMDEALQSLHGLGIADLLAELSNGKVSEEDMRIRVPLRTLRLMMTREQNRRNNPN